MKTIKVSDIFDVQYGVNLELVNLEECNKDEKDSINFVSRTEKNNGVSTYVRRLSDVVPNPARTLSVAGGGSVLSTFYQKQEYYSGRDIYVLIPKRNISETEILFYAFCIRQNKYRYNYGRQANKTLKELQIPESIPKYWGDINLRRVEELKSVSLNKKKKELETKVWREFKIKDLFNIEKGERLNKEDREPGNTPLVTSKDENQGVAEFIDLESNVHGKRLFTDSISIDMFGNSFFHAGRYFGDDNVHPLIWRDEYKAEINKYINLFVVTILQKLRLKYSYGRQVRLERLNVEAIKLPSKNDVPDWQFMQDYIKSLPYSSSV